jgi:hypothetical protein
MSQSGLGCAIFATPGPLTRATEEKVRSPGFRSEKRLILHQDLGKRGMLRSRDRRALMPAPERACSSWLLELVPARTVKEAPPAE